MAKPKHEDTAERLASLGHRLTAQRIVILEALSRSRQTVTAQELYEQLKPGHPYLGRATVFRNLDALVEVGLAQRFERAGHVYAYASCSQEHHHHLICVHCHKATEVSEVTVAPLVAELQASEGFVVEHSALDFYGTCRDCR